MDRTIFASRDISTKMKLMKQSKITVYSFFPIDRPDCVCQPLIEEFKLKLAAMPTHKREAIIQDQKAFECPASHVGKKRYEIFCKNCGRIEGYLWASDKTLEDWVDFHYAQWTNGIVWHGCLTPNVSPIDGRLGLECTCGNDTRDFRANMTLPGKTAFEMEQKNKIGRRFNELNSRFGVRDVTVLKMSTIESRISSKIF